MATESPKDASARLTRKQLAEALTVENYPITVGSLNVLASRGGGPPYRLWGRTPLYEWGQALKWAEGRLRAPRRSGSAHDAAVSAAD